MCPGSPDIMSLTIMAAVWVSYSFCKYGLVMAARWDSFTWVHEHVKVTKADVMTTGGTMLKGHLSWESSWVGPTSTGPGTGLQSSYGVDRNVIRL